MDQMSKHKQILKYGGGISPCPFTFFQFHIKDLEYYSLFFEDSPFGLLQGTLTRASQVCNNIGGKDNIYLCNVLSFPPY